MDDRHLTIETSTGDFRVRVVHDTDAPNPREDDDQLVYVLTIETLGGYYPPVDEDGGPLQVQWDRISWRDDAVEVFTRYARIYHGVTVVEPAPGDGPRTLWYLTPDDALIGGVTDPEAYVRGECDEYLTWASGEVFGYVIEERVVYRRVLATGDESKDWLWRYEEVESLWGIYGLDEVTTQARGAIDFYEPARVTV